ncbi:hypothetical protein [Ferruginibacter profundus]
MTKIKMTIKRILTLFLFCILGQLLFAQDSTSKFYPEANGTIGNRTHVNALSFRTQNVTTPFFDALHKRFSTPKSDGEFLQFNGHNKNWSKNKIIIRTSSSIDINLDRSKTNTIFIFVETTNKYDLLKPTRTSYKKIVKYFWVLFNKTIKNGKSDNFD